jgi:hypothetical protein
MEIGCREKARGMAEAVTEKLGLMMTRCKVEEMVSVSAWENVTLQLKGVCGKMDQQNKRIMKVLLHRKMWAMLSSWISKNKEEEAGVMPASLCL